MKEGHLNPSQVAVIVGRITTWHLLALEETHFFISTIKLTVLLCKELGEKVCVRKGTPGLGRPPASLWLKQCGLQMVTTATNCLLSTSLNIPTWGNQKKKTQEPLQAFKNSHSLTATTVSQTFLYALFIAHSRYTFVLCTSYWQCSFYTVAQVIARDIPHCILRETAFL